MRETEVLRSAICHDRRALPRTAQHRGTRSQNQLRTHRRRDASRSQTAGYSRNVFRDIFVTHLSDPPNTLNSGQSFVHADQLWHRAMRIILFEPKDSPSLRLGWESRWNVNELLFPSYQSLLYPTKKATRCKSRNLRSVFEVTSVRAGCGKSLMSLTICSRQSFRSSNGPSVRR
jgi:hypothetical protein